MGSARKGAIVGYAEWATERRYERPAFMLEQWMDLAAEALADAGLALGDVDGLVCGTLREANMFVPATVVEYLGQPVKFGVRRPWGCHGHGHALACGRGHRAGALRCRAVRCGPAHPVKPDPRDRPPWKPGGQGPPRTLGGPPGGFGAFGNVAQNAGYAMIAAHYEARRILRTGPGPNHGSAAGQRGLESFGCFL